MDRPRKGGGKRVLVCDDERHIVRLIEVDLGRQGYEVACAYGGQEAIDRLRREEFDLAVIDLDMPGVDGHEVLRWIRSHERTKAMRVVLLSAKSPPGDGDNPPGSDPYLTKHFNLHELFH